MDMQPALFTPVLEHTSEGPLKSITLHGKERSVSPVFTAYWRFASERHAIFHRRLNGTFPFTADPILQRFKFTNAYRILDRTTQYLIREVLNHGDQSSEEVCFRVLLFKLFNKIETWELLTGTLGLVSFAEYRFERYDRVLEEALASGKRIYSAAYIMPSGGSHGESRKHRSHLRLLENIMRDRLADKLADSRNMAMGFRLLRSYPMIGDFLAYQFITDLNYTDICSYSEMEFVAAGPGSFDGLRKCFPDMTIAEGPSLIREVCENQVELQRAVGLPPVNLWGRPLQLIDCQNLFCEVDKYARIAYPSISGFSGRTRIKQTFRMTGPTPDPVFPPKWKLCPR